jgi:WXG100 family type VII secretion target
VPTIRVVPDELRAAAERFRRAAERIRAHHRELAATAGRVRSDLASLPEVARSFGTMWSRWSVAMNALAHELESRARDLAASADGYAETDATCVPPHAASVPPARP